MEIFYTFLKMHHWFLNDKTANPLLFSFVDDFLSISLSYSLLLTVFRAIFSQGFEIHICNFQSSFEGFFFPISG